MTQRVPHLDGIRGLAVLMVIGFHYTMMPGLHQWEASLPVRLAQMGWMGVDLFFVLSGFLLGGILIDRKGEANYYRSFFVRRAGRILPLYWLWLGAYVVVVSIWPQGGFSGGATPFGYHLVFLQNIYMAAHDGPQWGSHSAWLSSSWSLAVEEQFYLVVPFLIGCTRLATSKRLLLGYIVAAPFLRWMLILLWHGQAVGPLYYLLPTHGDGLAVGIVIAMAVRNSRVQEFYQRNRPAFMMGAGGLSMSIVGEYLKLPPTGEIRGIAASFFYLPIALIFGWLIFETTTMPIAKPARVLRFSALQFFGRISYCLYLIHGVVMLSIQRPIAHMFQIRTLSSLVMVKLLCNGIALGTSVLICVLSGRFYELPARAWINRRFSSRRPLSSAAGPSATLPPQRPSSVACTSDSVPAFQRSA